MDCAKITNQSHEYYLECGVFTNQSRVYYLDYLFYSALKSTHVKGLTPIMRKSVVVKKNYWIGWFMNKNGIHKIFLLISFQFLSWIFLPDVGDMRSQLGMPVTARVDYRSGH